MFDPDFVIGILWDGQARAYPCPDVAAAGVVNDEIAGLPILLWAGDNLSHTCFRQVQGQTLTFRQEGTALVDVEKRLMTNQELLARYNYDAFIPANFQPWLNFGQSPPLGQPGPDFPLWHLDGRPERLSQVLWPQRYTVVEFGSFT